MKNSENFKKRTCWECQRPLSFHEFFSSNIGRSKHQLTQVWRSPHIELYCCQCYHIMISKITTHSHLETRKLIFLGLHNSGKSSMLKLLQTRNLTESTNLIPTRYINRVEMEYNNYKYCIWDFGGALKYRKRYFDSCHYFAHTDEIMYFIDITDESSYNDSLEYLTNLVEIFTAKYENLFPKDLKITILFHKIDPILLEKSKRVDRNIVWLEQKLSNIDFPCEYDIHLTSIYNFDKEHLSSLYEQELYECLSNVIIDAFSKNVLM